MSIEREIKRRNALKNEKDNGIRRVCRRCKARMFVKPGYGCVCQECGWESHGQKRARMELEGLR